ncbi:MAG: hypothetical protein SFW07_04825 [Gammaproteobacteria bacterium]|nr:hypothetical protein [Gammaproteobacteria bacterium]
MAHERMKEANYWYGDEDVNAVVARVRENTKNPLSDGTHVIIFDVVNGQEGVPNTDPQSIVQRLSKENRAAGVDTFAEALNAIEKQNDIWLPEGEKKQKIRAFVENEHATDKEFQKLLLNKLEELEYDRYQLESFLKSEDVFSEIASLWRGGDAEQSPFRVLFPVNLGIYNAGKTDSGAHWVLGEIELKKKGEQVTVKTRKHDTSDTSGGQFSKSFQDAMSKTITDRLQTELGFDLIVAFTRDVVTSPRTQDDGSSCGPITCDNLVLRAQSKEIPKETVPAGAQKLRQQQYDMVKPKPVASFTTAKSSEGNKWDAVREKQLQAEYPEIFKNVKKAKLVEHTVQTTDLTDNNLEEFVKSTKALMQKLGVDGAVEVNAPEGAKQKLIQLCKKHGLKLASEAKSDSVKKIETERMDKVEGATTQRSPAMAV